MTAWIGAAILVGAPLPAGTAMGARRRSRLAPAPGPLLARRLRVELPAGTRRESWRRWVGAKLFGPGSDHLTMQGGERICAGITGSTVVGAAPLCLILVRIL